MRRRAALLAASLALACQGEGLEPAARGRLVYAANCTACHHPDPSIDGPVGPAVVGSSLELVEARVLRGEYPPGYTPKRDGALMPPQPYLAPDIPALAAYLNDGR